MTRGHVRRTFRDVQAISQLNRMLTAHGIALAEVAAELRLDPSAVSRKFSGQRPLKLTEIQALLAFLGRRLHRPVTYEEVFGSVADEAVVVDGAVSIYAAGTTVADPLAVVNLLAVAVMVTLPLATPWM